MPWHSKAMKDATTCEKRWGAGCELRSVDIRMGQPNMYSMLSLCERISEARLREVKHLST